MIKRTLCFSNPAYLSLKNEQLVIKLPQVEKNDDLPESFKADVVKTIPIEDVGVVVLDNKQITITQGLMEALLDNNVVSDRKCKKLLKAIQSFHLSKYSNASTISKYTPSKPALRMRLR